MAEEKGITISKKTLVPVSVAMGAIIFMVGPIMWLTTLYNKVEALQVTVERNTIIIEKLEENNNNTNERMARIEEKIDAILQVFNEIAYGE